MKDKLRTLLWFVAGALVVLGFPVALVVACFIVAATYTTLVGKGFVGGIFVALVAGTALYGKILVPLAGLLYGKLVFARTNPKFQSAVVLGVVWRLLGVALCGLVVLIIPAFADGWLYPGGTRTGSIYVHLGSLALWCLPMAVYAGGAWMTQQWLMDRQQNV